MYFDLWSMMFSFLHFRYRTLKVLVFLFFVVIFLLFLQPFFGQTFSEFASLLFMENPLGTYLENEEHSQSFFFSKCT